jgi:membrane protein implicated in regulation of membrane protease activity
MRRILHYTSITGTFLLVFGLLLFAQMFIVYLIPVLREWAFENKLLLEIILGIIALVLMKRFVKISSPHKSH